MYPVFMLEFFGTLVWQHSSAIPGHVDTPSQFLESCVFLFSQSPIIMQPYQQYIQFTILTTLSAEGFHAVHSFFQWC